MAMHEQARLVIPEGPQDFTVTWQGAFMACTLTPPRMSGGEEAEGAWVFHGRREQRRVLAGEVGRSILDRFGRGPLEVVREVWVSGQGGAVAVRQTVVNTADRTVRLGELRPLVCMGRESLVIENIPAGRWEVLRQARFKNEIPSAVRLGQFDEDYEHATFAVGEQGDLPAAADGQAVRLTMDSFGAIRTHAPACRTHLLVGLLSQTGHLAHIELETDAQRRELARLAAVCEFDGCELPPGGGRSSQWVLLLLGDTAQELIESFADRVGRHHRVSPPVGRPPAVWCSWYYYGPYFYEQQLHEELAYLEEHRLPFDVLLIDDSRPRPWGDWLEHDLWPSGMKDAADRIRGLGYRPGIWTCPFLAGIESRFASEHPHWLLRRADGEPVLFDMDGRNYVLDPTYPGVEQHLEALFRTMTDDWGFTYHKLDFLRAVYLDPRARYYDPSVTRLEAYRRGLEAVRRGAGPEAYISVCGGHYGGSLGLADSQRSGSDVVACWDTPPALPRIKQNLMRTWMNRLWHTDADAMMVRRRETPLNDSKWGRLSLGRFTDEEARTIAANQYVGGGLLCATERFTDIDSERLALYRHVVPPLPSPGIPLDPFAPRCPSQMLNRIEPRCEPLGPWATVTVFNWADRPADQRVTLSPQVVAGLEAERFLVFEFIEQRVLGVFNAGDAITIEALPAHGCRVLRVAPWGGERAVLAGTDLHFSGGGAEIAAWRATSHQAHGRIDTRWQHPVRVTVAFPTAEAFVVRTAVVEPGQQAFDLALHDVEPRSVSLQRR